MVSNRLFPFLDSFTLGGAPRTKKNHGKIIVRGKRVLHVPSDAHQKWFLRAMLDANKARARNPVLYPVPHPINVSAVFYCEANTGDPVGYYQALADLLQAAGIVGDDKQIRTWWGTYLALDRVNPRIEVMLQGFPPSLTAIASPIHKK